MRLIWLLQLTILTAFFGVAFRASADDEVAEPERVRPAELIEVPEGIVLRPRGDDGRRVVFRPDQEYKCFNVSEWNQAGHMITDYRWLWYYAIQMETKVALREQEIGSLELQLVIWKDNTTNAERALERMTGLLDKEHDHRVRSLRLKSVELWAWRLGTVVGLVAAGAFGAAWGVERSR